VAASRLADISTDYREGRPCVTLPLIALSTRIANEATRAVNGSPPD